MSISQTRLFGGSSVLLPKCFLVLLELHFIIALLLGQECDCFQLGIHRVFV
jgi:hypothetical protein